MAPCRDLKTNIQGVIPYGTFDGGFSLGRLLRGSPSAPPNITRAWRFRQASPAGTKGKARAFPIPGLLRRVSIITSILKLYGNCIVGKWVWSG